jgi:4-diphosphocytidyl-2-C-methyl-D-erythritol kinase
MRSHELLAPAKVNLYLHVTNRLANGYHELDSVVAFADIGDIINIEPSTALSFSIRGPYAKSFNSKEHDVSEDSENLIIKSIWQVAKVFDREPNFNVTLTKNLPLASGLGGGSSDAATVIWALCDYWDISHHSPQLMTILATLGADVPVCFSCKPSVVRGIGEVLTPFPFSEDLNVVIVNPDKRSSTEKVFKNFNIEMCKDDIEIPNHFNSFEDVITFLKAQENMLLNAAVKEVPEIAFVLDALSNQEECLFSRMTGSGASCFGVFKEEEFAARAYENIKNKHPDWWVKAANLNRPERY